MAVSSGQGPASLVGSDLQGPWPCLPWLRSRVPQGEVGLWEGGAGSGCWPGRCPLPQAEPTLGCLQHAASSGGRPAASWEGKAQWLQKAAVTM